MVIDNYFVALGNKSTVVYNLSSSEMMLVDEKDYNKAIEKVKLESANTIQTVDFETFEDVLDLGVETIVISCSEGCNLMCRYCYEADSKENCGEKRIFDVNDISKLIDLSIRINRNGVKEFHFFGGEPLLNFQMIKESCKQIVDAYENLGLEQPRFSITTNGTLINKDIADFFKEYKFSVCISLDGYKEVNDINRVSNSIESVYERVMDNITHLGGIPIACESTISYNILTKMNNEEIRNYAKYFVTSPFDYLGVFPESSSKTPSGELISKYIYFFECLIDSYFDELKQTDVKKIPVILSLIPVIFSIMHGVDNKIGPCKAGITQVFINPSLEIYPCQAYHVANQEKLGEYNDLSIIQENIIQQKKYFFNRMPENCKTCLYLKYCSLKSCPGDSYRLFGKSNSINLLLCTISKSVVNRTIMCLGNIMDDEGYAQNFIKSIQQHASKYNDIKITY